MKCIKKNSFSLWKFNMLRLPPDFHMTWSAQVTWSVLNMRSQTLHIQHWSCDTCASCHNHAFYCRIFTSGELAKCNGWTNTSKLGHFIHFFWCHLKSDVRKNQWNALEGHVRHSTWHIASPPVSREQSCFRENIHCALDCTVFWLGNLKLFKLSNF